ncbi:hypothetical protein WR25_19064 [Diploscapter pachys]|uniref:Uncharacterized protein n=1 Tax=Diploscapter pachys TaxID=2018661 RepID=A0A2A2M4K8_9BILA|nr:hypothetical protein WR25_19064 [Diploscapter pachys]
MPCSVVFSQLPLRMVLPLPRRSLALPRITRAAQRLAGVAQVHLQQRAPGRQRHVAVTGIDAQFEFVRLEARFISGAQQQQTVVDQSHSCKVSLVVIGSSGNRILTPARNGCASSASPWLASSTASTVPERWP